MIKLHVIYPCQYKNITEKDALKWTLFEVKDNFVSSSLDIGFSCSILTEHSTKQLIICILPIILKSEE